MHGNVGERVFDWYALYSEQDEIDPIGPSSGDRKIIRGGYYMSSNENLSSYGKKFQTPNILIVVLVLD